MRDGAWKVLAKLDIKRRVTVTADDEAEVKAAKLFDFEIYKITDDIGESEDLSDSNPEKLAELTQRLKTNYQELVDGSHVWPKRKK